MRFISKHRGYHFAIRPATLGGYNSSGDAFYTGDAMNAQFQQGGVTPEETTAALERWDGHWEGLAEGVDPRTRLSIFDTVAAQRENNWTDEEREFAEDRLLNAPGRLGNEYIRIEEKQAELPWPSYKTFNSPERIVSFMREGGVDPEVVLTYERENQNREDILDAVENAGHEDVVEHEVVVKA